MTERDPIELNGTTYRWPRRPVVVVCVDGGDPAYFDRGVEDGIIPNIEGFMKRGFSALAESVVPSFTNPNNMSIVTGSPPSVHGISGNFFLDPDTGAEVMMNDPKFLRSTSLLAEFSRRGGKVVAITAKDKLRRQLGKGLDIAAGSMSFSSEKADTCTLAEHGVEDVLELVGWPLPDIYSAELSLFVIEAGIRLLERHRPDLMYLSLTDYVQHKHAPGSKESDDFHVKLDDGFGRLAALGAIVALTADHGMNDKSKPDGSPNVVFVQDELDKAFGAGATRVICPITDPYVVHHGALGGFVRVYCYEGAAREEVMRRVRELPGVEAVYDKAAACEAFDLPADREADVVVISDAGTVLGSSEAAHDLSGLEGHRLRSHGGVAERTVPFIVSAPLNETYASRAQSRRLRNFDIFDFAINGVEAS